MQRGAASDTAQPSTSGRRSAHQLAREHQEEVALVQDLLKQKGLHSLPDRISSSEAELIRYWLLCLMSRIAAC